MSRPHLIVCAGQDLLASFFPPAQQRRLSRLFRWQRDGARKVTPGLRRKLLRAQALITTWDSPNFSEDLPRLAPQLRIIAHCGGEVKSRFARPLFETLTITTAPVPMARATAEMGAALLLYSARNVDLYRSALRNRSNRIYDDVHLHGAPESLIGREVAMIGFGRIGRALVDLMRGFDLEWLVFDPYVQTSLAKKYPVRLVGLQTLLHRAHLLVLTAALTEETRGLLSRDRLAHLPDGAVVINIARGGLVDLAALTKEVQRKRLRCALDVTDPLEPLPVGHALRTLPGAIVTPHIAGSNRRVRQEMAQVVINDLESFFYGNGVDNRVNYRDARSDDVGMKLSFSTLACPDWTLPQIIAIAFAAGYDGIELRFVENEDSLWKLPVFRGKELAAAKRAFSDHGLTISCLDTSCRFHSPDANERARWLTEGERMADLAAELGAPGIRVFGDTIQPGADRASTRSWIADSIRKLAENTGPKGIEVWLETHGDFATASETSEILAEAGCAQTGAIWDPANCLVDSRERPQEGAARLRARIRHIHIKDLRQNHDGWRPVLTGDGDFPLPEVRTALQQLGYDRFVSFEWEKKWHPDIADATVALPHFTRWFREN